MRIKRNNASQRLIGAARVVRASTMSHSTNDRVALTAVYRDEWQARRRGQWLGSANLMLALLLAAGLGAYGLYSGAPPAFYIYAGTLVAVPVLTAIRTIVRGK